MSLALLSKYNVPGPRYTSYPTVPFWDVTPPSQEMWKKLVKESFDTHNHHGGISLYLHLPFCEKLCTFCGCNTRITINHSVEKVYAAALQKEWQLYLDIFQGVPEIRELHLGGGTPTFFSPENLKAIISDLKATASVAADASFSFEAHPGNTTREHLQALASVGFKRLSIGVQDFDPKVLEVINRKQTFEQVETLTVQARQEGYDSVNFDLVYGLPLQQMESFTDTVVKVIGLQPDRIALYSYAHVPWVKPGQRKFTELDLPSADRKLAMYQKAYELLIAAGYVDIGMDHFSLPSDELAKASIQKKLHRNFMGYTTETSPLLIGLGASAISDTGTAYAQNEKKIEDYYARINAGELPFFKGHQMTNLDGVIKQHILNLMCQFETEWSAYDPYSSLLDAASERLLELEKDGLIAIAPQKITVLPAGKSFVRNVCMAFDVHLFNSDKSSNLFSQTV